MDTMAYKLQHHLHFVCFILCAFTLRNHPRIFVGPLKCAAICVLVPYSQHAGKSQDIPCLDVPPTHIIDWLLWLSTTRTHFVSFCVQSPWIVTRECWLDLSRVRPYVYWFPTPNMPVSHRTYHMVQNSRIDTAPPLKNCRFDPMTCHFVLWNTWVDTFHRKLSVKILTIIEIVNKPTNNYGVFFAVLCMDGKCGQKIMRTGYHATEIHQLLFSQLYCDRKDFSFDIWHFFWG